MVVIQISVALLWYTDVVRRILVCIFSFGEDDEAEYETVSLLLARMGVDWHKAFDAGSPNLNLLVNADDVLISDEDATPGAILENAFDC